MLNVSLDIYSLLCFMKIHKISGDSNFIGDNHLQNEIKFEDENQTKQS